MKNDNALFSEHSYMKCCLLKIVKGCGMGPWFVLVSPGFRENVVATCKIG